MTNPNNPLSSDVTENDEDVSEFYGEDVDGPRRQSDNNDIVEPSTLENEDELREFIHNNLEVNRRSVESGIDIYVEVLDILA